jgi:hypothetical protein
MGFSGFTAYDAAQGQMDRMTPAPWPGYAYEELPSSAQWSFVSGRDLVNIQPPTVRPPSHPSRCSALKQPAATGCYWRRILSTTAGPVS